MVIIPIAAIIAQWYGTHQSLGSFPRVLLNWQLSLVTLQLSQEVCKGMSGTLSTVDASCPRCAVLGHRLMFTMIVNVLLSFKDIMMGYMLDHDYCVLKLRIHGLLVSK